MDNFGNTTRLSANLNCQPGNEERRQLNEAIRSALVIRGHISFVG
jgi:hypothetical protein